MKNSVSVGATLLRIALAFLLIVTGIYGIKGGADLFTGITGMINGSLGNIIKIILAVATLITGVLLIVELFGADFQFVDIVLVIFSILWLIQMVLFIIDSASGAFSSSAGILAFLHHIAYDLLVLAALIISQKKYA